MEEIVMLLAYMVSSRVAEGLSGLFAPFDLADSNLCLHSSLPL